MNVLSTPACRAACALLLCLALCSCGSKAADPPGESDRPPVAAGPEEANPLAAAPPPANPLSFAAPRREHPIWALEPLSPEALDRVQETIGQRVGVHVAALAPGGPAREWGVVAGDILVAADGEAVRTPEQVDLVLAAGGDRVAITLLRAAGRGEWRIVSLTVDRRPPASPAPDPAPVAAEPVAAAPAAVDRSIKGCVAAYFDMLDFCRTEGWGRRSTTPADTRTRAARLLSENLAGLDAESRAAIRKLPDVWAALREKWAAAPEADRARQREYWQGQLLIPNPLLPPPASLSHFKSEAGHHEFDYPTGWILAENRVEDTGMLYLGPPGTETTWEQVANPATSPPGALFLISPLKDELRASRNVLEGTRFLVRKYISPLAPDLAEVAAFPAGPGAIVVLRGKYPGQAEDSFLWLCSVPFGSEKFLAARFGGPASRAEDLLPVFTTMLVTMEVSPPDELAELQINLAFSIIGNAVVSTGWRH